MEQRSDKSDAKHSLRKTEVVPALGGQQRRDKKDWKRRETGRPFMLGPSKLISNRPAVAQSTAWPSPDLKPEGARGGRNWRANLPE